MARILLVSKPLAPPWNDSSKNLARDVATHLSRHQPIALTATGADWRAPGVEFESIYRPRGPFSPPLSSQARVLLRLARGDQDDIWHFFFAPNPKSSHAARVLCRIRRRPSIQTLCSRPRESQSLRRLLFADKTVVLSRHTETAVKRAGVDPETLCRIAPAVPPLSAHTGDRSAQSRAHFGLPQDALVIVYPGDLEFGEGAAMTLRAFAGLIEDQTRSEQTREGHLPRLVMACRSKTARAAGAEAALRLESRERGIEHLVVWVGETPRIHDLLACADVVTLASTTLYAKMDLPLVLIEAMYLKRPVLIARGSAAEELADGGAALLAEATTDGLKDALQRMLGDAAVRQSIGEAGCRSARQRFEPSAMARAYEELYDELLRPGAGKWR